MSTRPGARAAGSSVQEDIAASHGLEVAEVLRRASRLRRPRDQPAHAAISQWLGQLIGSGELTRGQRLPPERRLAEALGVSRMTLRGALDQLQTAGQIVRFGGGGGGSFVADHRLSVDVSNLIGLRAQLLRSVDTAASQVVRAETVDPPAVVREALGLPDGESAHEIVRVRFAASMPVVLERSYFPASLFPGMLEHDIAGSLYLLMDKHYGRAPHTADAELRPALVGADEARLLRMKGRSAVQQVLRTSRSGDGVTVEYSEDLFRTDLLRLTVSGRLVAATGSPGSGAAQRGRSR